MLVAAINSVRQSDMESVTHLPAMATIIATEATLQRPKNRNHELRIFFTQRILIRLNKKMMVIKMAIKRQ
jgi:hypothetical protein